jgi:hypothetical protein
MKEIVTAAVFAFGKARRFSESAHPIDLTRRPRVPAPTVTAPP